MALPDGNGVAGADLRERVRPAFGVPVGGVEVLRGIGIGRFVRLANEVPVLEHLPVPIRVRSTVPGVLGRRVGRDWRVGRGAVVRTARETEERSRDGGEHRSAGGPPSGTDVRTRVVHALHGTLLDDPRFSARARRRAVDREEP